MCRVRARKAHSWWSGNWYLGRVDCRRVLDLSRKLGGRGQRMRFKGWDGMLRALRLSCCRCRRWCDGRCRRWCRRWCRMGWREECCCHMSLGLGCLLDSRGVVWSLGSIMRREECCYQALLSLGCLLSSGATRWSLGCMDCGTLSGLINSKHLRFGRLRH